MAVGVEVFDAAPAGALSSRKQAVTFDPFGDFATRGYLRNVADTVGGHTLTDHIAGGLVKKSTQFRCDELLGGFYILCLPLKTTPSVSQSI
jgi:hypothetical protein